ncbi:hypothetical protein BDA96_10G334400 [Sorghum bicolor]|uniref:Uncharacterized protein n=2 Tax=Sorghum bicolor TaxID=4558 RepID=A0A1W0VUY2_SORBI|nr:hypothetical protein BDA96_10G334400 [Sorghum bicolor]OQU77075.1 hypothetical protein SORBI_3010G259266 [Sorghum bicolor]
MATDILVVVSNLLFGFGCGAFTAMSMYFVWSLLANTCATSYEDNEDQRRRFASRRERERERTQISVPIRRIGK